MRYLCWMILLAGFTVLQGCPSGDDDDDDSAGGPADDDDSAEGVEDGVDVLGADPCAPLASTCWIAYQEESTMFASTVADFCAKTSAHDVYLTSEEYRDAMDAVDAAEALEDGPGACQAATALYSLYAPVWDAVFEAGSCTLAVTAGAFVAGEVEANFSLVYMTQNMGACFVEGLGDCSQAIDWATWLDLNEDVGLSCSQGMSGYYADGAVGITPLQGDAFEATTSGQQMEGFTLPTQGTTVTVDIHVAADLAQ